MLSPSGQSRAVMVRWAAMLLVGGVGLLIPKIALASCGNYLAMLEHEHPEARRLLSGNAPTQMPERPCQGSHCRHAPAPTSPTAPTRIEHHLEQWALISHLAGIAASLGDSLVMVPLMNAGAAHPLPIDHPPR